MKKSKKKQGSFASRHRTLLIFCVVLIPVSFLLLAVVAGYLNRYRVQASKFDLDDITRIDGGCVAYDAKGNILGQVSLKDRRLISMSHIPNHLANALVATEDSRFATHGGVDPKGILRAAVANYKAGGVVQGGSTITQQLARHAFPLGGRTLERKLLETFVAMRIEKAYSKDEIMQHYFNRIYLGSGYWGIEAAARGYFDKATGELDVSEAAAICALIKSPNRFSPFNDLEASREARNRTLFRMNTMGFLSASDYERWKSMPLVVVSGAERSERPNYLLAALRREALSVLGQYERLEGLTIKTTVDLHVQKTATHQLSEHLNAIEALDGYSLPKKGEAVYDSGDAPEYLQGAVVVIENRSGDIVSAVCGRDFSQSEFNRVWDARRKAGTMITPLVYAAAFDEGKVKPWDNVLDAPFDNRQVMIGGTKGVLGEWGTETEKNRYEGEIPVLSALVKGKNGAAVRVGQKVGVESFAETLTRAGFSSEPTGFANMYLGESPVGLLELVRAYSAFPNQGLMAKESRMITEIRDEAGELLYRRPEEQDSGRVWSEDSAETIRASLEKILDVDPARSLVGDLSPGHGGKAGTSYNYEDVWFVGFNDSYTWGVWVGFDVPYQTKTDAFANDFALPLWLSLADSLLAKPDDRREVQPDRPGFCLLNGCQATENCQFSSNGNFKLVLPEALAGAIPDEVCPIHTSKYAPPSKKVTLSARPRKAPVGFKSVVPKVDQVVGGNPWKE